MLRITETPDNCKTIRLRLDGTITVENFQQVAELCASYRQENARTIIMDLAGVNFMSEAAAKSLADLRCDWLRVINCSPFIAALLNAASDPD